MMSRVILVAMLPPSGATWCDLLAIMVETTLHTGTSSLARALFSRPLAIWTPVRRVLRGRDDGDTPLSLLTYESPWVAAIARVSSGVLNGGHRTLTFWQPIASMLTSAPFRSSSFSNAGMAVISLLLSETATWAS